MTTPQTQSSIITLFSVSTGIVLIDLASKMIAMQNIIAPYYIIGNAGFILTKNHGIAFSLPLTGLPQIAITIAILIGLIGYVIKNSTQLSKYQILAFGSIIGGALGNLWERMLGNGVTDFIQIHQAFPVFNIADIAISLGAIALIILNNEEARS